MLADVAQLVDAGARHITFGDPDFLNAPPHSLRVVRAMHERFPDVTFDCTVKVEHVLRHADLWPELAAAGCLFVVSAFESVDDAMLERLDKGHTAADAGARGRDPARRGHRRAAVVAAVHAVDHASTTSRALLDFVARARPRRQRRPGAVHVRLLLPEGSLLLDHPDLVPYLGPWDDERSTYTWASADPAVDELQQRIAALVEAATATRVDALRARSAPRPARRPSTSPHVTTGRPRLSESWFCCAEPTELQLTAVRRRRGARPKSLLALR